MRILFTTNNRWGSRLIRWCTSEDVSHVAIQLEDIVCHSTMAGGGVNLQWASSFKEHNAIVAGVELPNDCSLLHKLSLISSDGYDWALLLTMALRRIWKAAPVIDNPYRDICTEVVTEQVLGIKDKLTPGQLLALLKERQNHG